MLSRKREKNMTDFESERETEIERKIDHLNVDAQVGIIVNKNNFGFLFLIIGIFEFTGC